MTDERFLELVLEEHKIICDALYEEAVRGMKEGKYGAFDIVAYVTQRIRESTAELEKDFFNVRRVSGNKPDDKES